MEVHGRTAHHEYAQNAATNTQRVRSFDELRMALEDKARAQRIKALREQKRLTQDKMRQIVGVSYRAYQTWESETKPVMPDWPNLEALAKAHGVKPEDIIGETPDVGALLGNGESPSQLASIEAAIADLRAEVATARDEVAALEVALTKQLRSIARKLGTSGMGSQSQTGG